MFLRSRSVIAVCLAVLHLCVVPVTHVLHIGCTGHDHGSASHGCSHSCCHHQAQHPPEGENPNGSEPAEPAVPEPHDSGNCAICQVAFSPGLALAVVIVLDLSRTITMDAQARPQHVITNSLSPTQLRGPPAV